ncbi:MAG: hypothetical protein ACRBEQ_04770 [Hyphomonas sp.]
MVRAVRLAIAGSFITCIACVTNAAKAESPIDDSAKRLCIASIASVRAYNVFGSSPDTPTEDMLAYMLDVYNFADLETDLEKNKLKSDLARGFASILGMKEHGDPAHLEYEEFTVIADACQENSEFNANSWLPPIE